MPSTISRDEFKKLQDKVSQLEKQMTTGVKKPKIRRKATTYNLFIGNKIKEISASNPDMPHKEVFSASVEAWKEKKRLDEAAAAK